MSIRTGQSGSVERGVVALLDDQPGAYKAELSQLREIPLPGRSAVRLSDGEDPRGLVPGYAEALVRRERVLEVLVHCPQVPVAYSLEEVLIRRGEVEVHLVLFATGRPRSENEKMARLSLRFQTASDHLEARVQSTLARRHAASRGGRLAQARQRAGASAPLRSPSSETETDLSAHPYTLDIDDGDDDGLPPPFNPDRLFEEGGPQTQGGLQATARLVGLFLLFLATVVTWKVVSTNQSASAHDHFNQRLAARLAAARADAPTTSVRLDGAPVLTGDLDQDAVEEALLPVLESVGSCYMDLEGWATLPPEGRATFTLTLGPGRRVLDVEPSEVTLDSERVVACAVEAFLGLRGLESGEGTVNLMLALQFSG